MSAKTGMDIASEAAQCGAAEVFLSCRRPVHVVPRHIFCVPSDAALPSWLGEPSQHAMHGLHQRRHEESRFGCKALVCCV